MDITIKTVEKVTVVDLAGDIDGKTASQVQEQILPLLQPGCKVVLNMTGVEYMSSAGLRLMLTTHRQASSNNGKVVLVGVSNEIQETMSATGFLRFFTLADTVKAGVAALKE
jgi:anti-sigma B factor antagonist